MSEWEHHKEWEGRLGTHGYKMSILHVTLNSINGKCTQISEKHLEKQLKILKRGIIDTLREHIKWNNIKCSMKNKEGRKISHRQQVKNCYKHGWY